MRRVKVACVVTVLSILASAFAGGNVQDGQAVHGKLIPKVLWETDELVALQGSHGWVYKKLKSTKTAEEYGFPDISEFLLEYPDMEGGRVETILSWRPGRHDFEGRRILMFRGISSDEKTIVEVIVAPKTSSEERVNIQLAAGYGFFDSHLYWVLNDGRHNAISRGNWGVNVVTRIHGYNWPKELVVDIHEELEAKSRRPLP